jgi:4-amino-4-deoxy-L-arabinose transferase-like glycosyltransferase
LQPSALAKRGNILLLLALIAFYFYGLGHLPLIGPDEPRYAQVAREMLIRGDLITPTLGGYLWFEKPALLYWLLMASYKLFGVSEWSTRLPAAFSGLVTIAAVFLIGRRVEGAAPDEQLPAFGSWSAVVLATTLGIAVFSRAASFDILLTMSTTWTLAFFIISELQQDPKLRRRFLVGFYAFVGVSLLAKGLVGLVIPLGVVGVYYAFRRRLPQRNLILTLGWGIPLALAVAAVWYAPVIWKHGWPFIDQFFIQHHFARYITNRYRHPKPPYYYVLIFPLLFLPWTFFLIGGLLRSEHWRWLRSEARGGYARTRDSEQVDKLRAFAVAWLLVPLVFFSFSTSKLPGYILPVLPAAALMVGETLSRLGSRSGYVEWAPKLTAALLLVLAVAAPFYASRSGKFSVACGLMMAMPLAVAGFFALLSSRPAASAMLIAGATSLALVVVLNCGAPAYAEHESAKRLLELAASKGYSQTAIYGMQRDDRSPEFYAPGRVVYGPDGEPVFYDNAGPVIDESRRRGGEALLVFVRIEDVSLWSRYQSVAADVIGDNGRYAILAVRAQ